MIGFGRISLRRGPQIGHTRKVSCTPTTGARIPGGAATLSSELAPADSAVTSDAVRFRGPAIVLAGLICSVVGTFSPWLISGGVDRDSYAIAGIIDRLGLAGAGYPSTALTWWPFIGPIAMIALIAGILRWWRSAAWIAAVFAVLTGVIGGGVIAGAGGHLSAGIEVARTGPVVTVVGAVVVILGAVVVLIGGRRSSSPRVEAWNK